MSGMIQSVDTISFSIFPFVYLAAVRGKEAPMKYARTSSIPCSGARMRMAYAALMTLMCACGGSEAPSTVPNPPTVVSSLEISAAVTTLQVGSSTTCTATVRAQSGDVISGRTVSWTSSTPSVATIDANGRVTALAAGATLISAQVDGVKGEISLTVLPAPDFALLVTSPSSIQAGGPPVLMRVSVSANEQFRDRVILSLRDFPEGTTTQPTMPIEVPSGAGQEFALSIPRSAETKTFQGTLRGTSGILVKDATLSLQVLSPPEFDLTVTPSLSVLRPGASVGAMVAVSTRNGFVDTVTVSSLTLPPGISVTPSLMRIPVGGLARVTLTASPTAPPATYPLTFRGVAPAVSRDASMSLQVVPSVWYHTVGSTLVLDRVEQGDSVRVVVDGARGATITEISLSGRNFVSESVGNRGLQVQLLEGNGAYDDCRGCTGGYFGYSPTQEGDRLGNRSLLLASEATNDGLYSKTQLVDWAPDLKNARGALPSDVILEQWVRAVPGEVRALHVHYKVTHVGSDTHLGGPQSLPALSVPASLDRFVTYGGTAPWTGGPVNSSVWPSGLGTTSVMASENWGAWSDVSGVGIAVYNPGDYSIVRVKKDAGGTPSGASPFNRLSSFTQRGLRPREAFEKDVVVAVGGIEASRQTFARLRGAFAHVDIAEGTGFIAVPQQSATPISGTISGSGWAIDNIGVARVDILVDGVVRTSTVPTTTRTDLQSLYPGTSTTAGFAFSLDTRTLSDGEHDISGRVVDAAGNVGEMYPRRVTVLNSAQSQLTFDVSVGPIEVVIDGPSTACGPLDIFDLPLRAVRLSDGTVLAIAANAPSTFMMKGGDLTHLRKTCVDALPSPKSVSARQYENWYWIGSLFRQGAVVHALIHNEYHDPVSPSCRIGDTSPANPCWYNSINYASSVDNGQSFRTPTAPLQVVAPAPETWNPAAPWRCNGSSHCPHYGYETPTNMFTGLDGRIYAGFISVPGAAAPTQFGGMCLMRTTTPSDPSSWRAWDGASFSLEMQSPYASGSTIVPACAYVDPLNLPAGATSITYSTYLQRYIAIGYSQDVSNCGFTYSTSRDLIRWTASALLYRHPLNTYCGNSASLRGKAAYPTLIDPTDGGDNFDRAGPRPYLYFVRWNGDTQFTREIVRVPLAFNIR